jgi:hypothetical protein
LQPLAAEAGLDALGQERLAVEVRVIVEARMPHGRADLLDFDVERPAAEAEPVTAAS